MKFDVILFVLTFLVQDLAVGADSAEPIGESPLDNPWKAWQHPEFYGHHELTRRSAPSRDAVTSAERDDELYTARATSSGGYASHQRRHHRADNRRRERGKDDVGKDKAMAAMARLGGLDENGHWPENCTYCAMRQASKEYRLEQIRREILAKLRLESPPNITDKRLPQYPEITEWLSKFPETPADDDTLEPMVKIISMINIAHAPPPEKTLPDMANVCYFEFQSDVEPADIVSAKLGVFVRQVSVPTHTITMFLIYKVKPRRRGNILIKRKRVTLNNDDTNKWYRFDVDAVVKNWVRNPANNYGLQIMIFDDYGQSLAIVTPESDEEELYKPYIDLTLKSRPRPVNRDKRMISLECEDETTATTACCRYPMIIDFSGFGWDWILSPKTLEAHYCSGECNHSFLSATHSHIVEQARGGYQTACCVPQKYNVLKMVYYSNRERIQFGIVHGIIVDRCGCT